MDESIFNEQKVNFSVSIPQELFERMEELRNGEAFKISRSAYVVGMVREGVERLEAQNSN